MTVVRYRTDTPAYARMKAAGFDIVDVISDFMTSSGGITITATDLFLVKFFCVCGKTEYIAFTKCMMQEYDGDIALMLEVCGHMSATHLE